MDDRLQRADATVAAMLDLAGVSVTAEERSRVADQWARLVARLEGMDRISLEGQEPAGTFRLRPAGVLPPRGRGRAKRAAGGGVRGPLRRRPSARDRAGRASRSHASHPGSWSRGGRVPGGRSRAARSRERR